MHFCFVTQEYPPYVSSGSGVYTLSLIESLCKDPKNTLTIITTNSWGGKAYEKKGNLEIYRLNIFPPRFLRLSFFKDHTDAPFGGFIFNFKLWRFFSKFPLEKYDLLHITDARSSYFVTQKLQQKIPLIMGINSYYEFEVSWNPFRFMYPCRDFFVR